MWRRIVPSQKASRRGALEQPLGRLLQRRKVRHADEVQLFNERRVVRQMGDDASIVGLQEVLQRQASEELVLRELLRTARMRVRRQREPRRRERRQNDRLRRFTRHCHASITQRTRRLV
jgi:hypothetical protein